MGIKDEFHQKAILSCIGELLKPSEETTGGGGSGGSNVGVGGEQYNDYTSASNFNHNLTQHNFSTLERCEKCNKYLRGLLHQGFICQGDVSSIKSIYFQNE